MLSRVADSIYWLNRYIERAENVARFIDVNLNLMLDLPAGVSPQWKPLLRLRVLLLKWKRELELLQNFRHKFL